MEHLHSGVRSITLVPVSVVIEACGTYGETEASAALVKALGYDRPAAWAAKEAAEEVAYTSSSSITPSAACSCWRRGIDVCELQGCWSAALALCADAVRQVDFAQLWSRREVEARPSSAWAEPTSSVCRPWVPRTAWRRPWGP